MDGIGAIEVGKGLAAAAGLLKTLKNLVSTPDAKAQVVELYDVILATQAGALESQTKERSMQEEIGLLKEALARAKTWEEQKKRYKLVNPWEGAVALVFALKAEHKDSEPAHWICTKCYDDERRTMLQPKEDKSGFILLVCPTCKSEIHSGYRGIAPAAYAEN